MSDFEGEAVVAWVDVREEAIFQGQLEAYLMVEMGEICLFRLYYLYEVEGFFLARDGRNAPCGGSAFITSAFNPSSLSNSSSGIVFASVI